MITWDLTKSWTENVSKYMIELKSVYLTIVTWNLTENELKMCPRLDCTNICALNLVKFQI